MKRYETTKTKVDKSGMRVYSTPYYPEISVRGKVALSADEIIRIPGNVVNIVEKFKNLNKTG